MPIELSAENGLDVIDLPEEATLGERFFERLAETLAMAPVA